MGAREIVKFHGRLRSISIRESYNVISNLGESLVQLLRKDRLKYVAKLTCLTLCQILQVILTNIEQLLTTS